MAVRKQSHQQKVRVASRKANATKHQFRTSAGHGGHKAGGHGLAGHGKRR
jgi:hypothetical protein